jgi:hypothetical protein
MISFKEFVELDEQSWKRVNRVRSGQIQRRKMVSQRPGYRMQNGKLVRMSAAEKRKRHLAQVKAARKRKPMMSRILRKRKISIRRRSTAGIK